MACTALLAGKELRVGDYRRFPEVQQLSCRRLEVRGLSKEDDMQLLVETDGEVAGCCPVVIDLLEGAIQL